MNKKQHLTFWTMTFGYIVLLLSLLMLFFGFIVHAQAAITIDPTFIPDPTYPSGTPTTYTCDDSDDFGVAFDAISGEPIQGVMVCSGGGTPHPTGYWFGPGTDGLYEGTWILVESSDYTGTECGPIDQAGTDIELCRADDSYVSESAPFCVIDEDCEIPDPPDPGGESASSTPDIKPELQQMNMALMAIMFVVVFGFAYFLSSRFIL